MGNFSALKSTINSAIKTNLTGDITGNGLQSVLDAIVDVVGNGSMFMGIAVPTTEPASDPDGKQFYLACTNGTYTNFGGFANVNSDVIVIYSNGSGWSYQNLTTDITSAMATVNSRMDTIAEEYDDISKESASCGVVNVNKVSGQDTPFADCGKARAILTSEEYASLASVGMILAYKVQEEDSTFAHMEMYVGDTLDHFEDESYWATLAHTQYQN